MRYTKATRFFMQVNVLDTEKQLLELLEKVQAGEEVILERRQSKAVVKDSRVQSLAEGLNFLTHDNALAKYGEHVILV
jgi:hypothetical protein